MARRDGRVLCLALEGAGWEGGEPVGEDDFGAYWKAQESVLLFPGLESKSRVCALAVARHTCGVAWCLASAV